MERILIVEDDNYISDVLRRILEDADYEVEQAYSGTEALRLLEQETFCLVLLDLMLPGLTGEEVLEKVAIPVIVISAKSDVASRVHSLILGADDFIQKPFNNEEVLWRVRAVLRRSGAGALQEETIHFDDLVLNRHTMMASVQGHSIELTNYEYQILAILMDSPKRVFTKKNLYHMVWGYEYDGNENVINIHVSNIRKKLKVYSDKEYIKTIWGLGIKMNTEMQKR